MKFFPSSGFFHSMSASLIGRLGSSAFRLSTTAVSMSLTGSRLSSESAPRPFHHGIRGRGGTIFRAALPSEERQVQADMRTHLIHVPRGTSFRRSVELEFPSIGFDPARFSCCCRGLFPGPAELSAVNPYTVHDHRQPACQTPGGIIPLRWAASSRNGGRHHSVTAGDIISLRWAAWAGISK